MPLMKSKSPKAFEHNLKAEMHAGKPMKQSLAIAYSMKRKAKKMAEGGQITDNYQSPNYGHNQTHPDLKDHEKESGYMQHEGNVQRPNSMAMKEDDRRLGEHGMYEQGPYGVPPNSTPNPSKNPPFFADDLYDRDSDKEASMMAEGGQITDNYQSKDHMLDMVGRIMKQRQQHFSEGGKVANGGEDDFEQMADSRPNNFDDLSLRDDLRSTYGEDDNAGDSLGNDREDMDRADIVSRIMRQRKMKQHNPRPA